MTPPFARLEVWTDLACNGGVARAVLPVGTACVAEDEIINLLVSHKLTCNVPLTWSEKTELVVRRVLTVVYTDSTFDEYRISEVRDVSAQDGLIQVTALGIEYDLSDGLTLVSQTTNGVTGFRFAAFAASPTSHLATYVLGFGPTYIVAGSVTPSDTIDVSFAQDTPLTAALKIAAAANTATGGVYEIGVVRNGVTNYQLFLQVYNGAATVPFLTTGKSLRSTQRTLSTIEQTTRAVPIGSQAAGPGNNWGKVSAISVNVYVEVVDELGGPGPVQETDQFLNLYLEGDTGTRQQITGSSAQSAYTSRFLMASTTGFTAAKRCRLVANSTGDQISYVDAVANKTTYGTKLGVLTLPYDDTYNALLNPDLRAGTSGTSITSWTISGGGTWAYDTTPGNFLTGGKSAKWLTGTVLIDQIVTYQIPSSGAWYANYYIAFRVDANVTPGTLQFAAFYDGTQIAGSPINLNLSADGQWHVLYQSVLAASGSHTFQMSCSMGRTMWFDAGMIYFTKERAEVRAFCRGSNGLAMIQAANAHLLTNSAPIPTYVVRVLDLYRIDAVNAGLYETISLGGFAHLKDTELDIPTTSLRVVKMGTDLLVAHDTTVTLSTKPVVLTNRLAI